jgi:hypothetical protein
MKILLPESAANNNCNSQDKTTEGADDHHQGLIDGYHMNGTLILPSN